MKKNKLTEDQKTFSDLTQKPWITEGQKIKYGDNMSDFISGKVKVIDIKEFLFGDLFNTCKKKEIRKS